MYSIMDFISDMNSNIMSKKIISDMNIMGDMIHEVTML